MDDLKKFVPLNWALMSNPLNWVIVGLIFLIWGMGIALIFHPANGLDTGASQ